MMSYENIRHVRAQGGLRYHLIIKHHDVSEFFGAGHYSAEVSLTVDGRELVCLAGKLTVSNV